MNKLLLLIGVASAHLALGETDKPPTAPFVRFPERTAYTVEFTESPGAKPASAPAGEKKLVKIEVTKTASIRRDVDTWKNGSVTEEWYVGNLKLSQTERGTIYVMDPKRMVIVETGPRWDASDFSWLALDNYVGTIAFQGRQCYQFEKRARPESQQGQSAEVETVEAAFASKGGMALIDVETLLPVVLNNGVSCVTYKFKSPPDGDLQLPPKFTAEMERIHKMMEAPRRISDKP